MIVLLPVIMLCLSDQMCKTEFLSEKAILQQNAASTDLIAFRNYILHFFVSEGSHIKFWKINSFKLLLLLIQIFLSPRSREKIST